MPRPTSMPRTALADMNAYPLGGHSAGQSYVVTFDPVERRVVARTPDEWEVIVRRLLRLDVNRAGHRTLLRLVLGNAVELTADRDGVLWVPSPLAELQQAAEKVGG